MKEVRDPHGAAVEVEGLSRRYGTFTAVDDVTFSVAPGEIFGFLGPNGAGKTTTIKMLIGLVAPTSGQGRVAGLDIRGDRRAIRRRIGYMSQLFSLYADLSIEENLAFFSGLYNVPRARRAERQEQVLAMAGLADHRRRLTGELPLGWKQRLALASAVLHEPRVLFLDEPTSGVDPIARRQFWELIYALSGQGTTVFVSTHYMEEAEYCHRLALMNRGRLIALDTPGRLRRSMAEPILEIDVDRVPEAVPVVRSADEVMEAAMFGRRLHVTVTDAARAREDIGRRLAAAGHTVADVREVIPSLEDVFVSRVRAAGGAPID